MPERFRLHAVATQPAADRLARELEYADRDELLCSALLHDIGKLVLAHAYPGYPVADPRRPRAPPRSACTASASSWASTTRSSAACSPAAGRCRTGSRCAIERHHADDAEGEAALVRLADMLAHYGHAQPVNPKRAAEGRARPAGSRPSSCAR